MAEALCFGWIDGLMKSVDERLYIKGLSPRRKDRNWSEKNKDPVEKLEAAGLMTDFGRGKIIEAQANGQWDAPKTPPISRERVKTLAELLKEHEVAYANFMAMSPSVKRNYAGEYFAAKTNAVCESGLSWTIDRPNKNLKLM